MDKIQHNFYLISISCRPLVSGYVVFLYLSLLAHHFHAHRCETFICFFCPVIISIMNTVASNGFKEANWAITVRELI